ncbi:MAG TPA: VWA domain-containing protein [Acidimicrobiia bacterium]|nr:VWA domain-containing protein [Acidimicrobiia bacterium]
MTFGAPARLGLLALVAGLALAYLLAQRRRPRYAVRFTNLDLLDVVAPDRPGLRRHLPVITVLASAAAMVVALAEPGRPVLVSRATGAVMVAVDVSPSMMATDVAPSRLAAAQEAVARFAELLPDQIELGLVSFAGTAIVAVPPTSDHELIRRALEDLRFRSQTALGEAIHASLDALGANRGPGESGVVVLSDGATTTGRPDDAAARRARMAGVPVSTIAFGTPGGTVMLGGETLSVPPDGPALRAVADTTGGRFFEAASGAELTEVYRTIGRSVTTAEERQDLSSWFIGGALASLLLASALALAWFSRFP